MDINSKEHVVKTVQCNNTTVTLVGTAHVSKKSVELVEEMIRSGQYDCIAIELCKPRYENMVNQAGWRNLDIYRVFREKKAALLLVNLALSAYQKRLAEKIGAEAGREMQRAMELAAEYNIRLEVIDRNITTTLHRLVQKVSLWQKLKLFGGLMASIFVGEEITEQQIEDLKRGDVIHSVVEEFGEKLPAVKEVLIDERNRYMTGKLAELSASPDAPKNIIAMVGAGHLPGMVADFATPPNKEQLRSLDQKPPASRVGYYFGWGLGIFILSMFYVGYQQSPEIGWQLAVTWLVVNGSLSALGAALALAHPLSIVTAFLAAPITSLNPTIGAGMVVGIVESYLRKPKVLDFESLRDDISSWKMWWKNRVVRVFLVFFFANIGSVFGTYIAGAAMVRQLLG
ncbi:MAG: TraB/GumN family protein [Nitrospinales bacterium]